MISQKEKSTQEKKVLNYLLNNQGLTSIEAFSIFNITRLSDRIFTLRKKGHKIKSVPITKLNEEGRKIRYVRYELQKWKKEV